MYSQSEGELLALSSEISVQSRLKPGWNWTDCESFYISGWSENKQAALNDDKYEQ